MAEPRQIEIARSLIGTVSLLSMVSQLRPIHPSPVQDVMPTYDNECGTARTLLPLSSARRELLKFGLTVYCVPGLYARPILRYRARNFRLRLENGQENSCGPAALPYPHRTSGNYSAIRRKFEFRVLHSSCNPAYVPHNNGGAYRSIFEIRRCRANRVFGLRFSLLPPSSPCISTHNFLTSPSGGPSQLLGALPHNCIAQSMYGHFFAKGHPLIRQSIGQTDPEYL